MMAPLVWNVIYEDVPNKRISTYNVFRHTGMVQEIRIAFRRYKEKDLFEKELKRIIGSYFRLCREWKVCALSIDNEKMTQVSAHSQIMDNWNVFLDYVWNAKGHEMFSRKPEYEKRSKSERAWDIICQVIGKEDKTVSEVVAILMEQGFTRYLIERNREKWPLVQYEKDNTVYWHLQNI